MEGDRAYTCEYIVIALRVWFVLERANIFCFQELLREGLVTTLVHKIMDFVKENGRAHSKSSVRPESLKDSIKGSNYRDNVDSAVDSNRRLSPALRYIHCDKTK